MPNSPNGYHEPAETTVTGAMSRRRELDQRYSDGVLTTLEWCPDTDEVWIRCEQQGVSSPLLCCRVAAIDASRAFRHPFAYAYARVVSAPGAALVSNDGGRRVTVELAEGRQRSAVKELPRWARWMRACRRAFSCPPWYDDAFADLPEAWG
jgi:hypothetical protein